MKIIKNYQYIDIHDVFTKKGELKNG